MSVTSTAVLEQIAERDRLDAQIAADVAEFDANELWDLDDATSMQAWLRDKARMSSGQAHRLVIAARRTRPLPVTHAAWVSGELSGGQVEVILANVRKQLEAQARATTHRALPRTDKVRPRQEALQVVRTHHFQVRVGGA